MEVIFMSEKQVKFIEELLNNKDKFNQYIEFIEKANIEPPKNLEKNLWI